MAVQVKVVNRGEVSFVTRASDRRCGKLVRHIVVGLEHKEGLSCVANLHGEGDDFAIDPNLDNLLLRPEDAEFAETHVERRACKVAVGLLDDDDVDCAGEGGGVDLIVEFRNGREEVPDRIHGAAWEERRAGKKDEKDEKDEKGW